MNEEQYIKMIRAGLKKAKVFLKRAPNETRINAYNPMIMSLHRANMDIQYILDPYACLKYCVEYINKSENGMSKLLREALNELKKGNHTVKERLRVIANKFLNSSEISAQEAVYHILSIPLSVSSRSTVFINTNRPENRISMLKSDEILQKLEPDSKDVFVEGLIDMYVNRSDEMKDVCLADFASLYNVSKRKVDNTPIAENSDDEDATENENDEKTTAFKMKNGKGDIFVEMGLKTQTEKVENFNVPKVIPDTEYQQMMRSLNNNQRRYILNVMNLIKNKDNQFFHFINGGAGVGKSTLIKAIYQSILRFYNSLPGCNPETIRTALCAPTGKAAALIDGMKLHSFLSVPVNQCKHKLVQLNSDISNRIGVKLKDLQLSIIDEISMVGFTMFQHIDARLQQIMRTKKPFGGISVMVLEDFNQLRSVGDKYIFQFNNSYNALVDSSLWSLFELFELTEIMRQKDDKTFAIALSNLAKGTMTVEDIHLLKSRIVSTENLETIGDAIRIFRSNAEVDAYNRIVLSKLNTEGAIANAYDYCVGDRLPSIREKVLNNVNNLKTTETYGLPLEIDLKVGAKYMMTVNIDIEDGLVNGACGKLIAIDYRKLQKTNETVPCRLWIKFSEEKTGRKARANFHNVMRNRNIDLSLTPVEPVVRQINTRSTNFKVERKHRATKSTALYLIGDFVPPKPPEPKDAVAMMFKNMRSERMLKFSLEFPEESQEERFFVMFHNVQSLNKHIFDVRSDKTFSSASMISLVETWTKPSDCLEIEGFKIIHRRDCNDIRKPFGQITYLKNDLKYENITEKYEYSGKNHIEYSSIKIDDICIISVYNSPNSSFDVLKRHINEVITISKGFCENIIVVGDFNINLKVKTNNKFIEYMKSFGFNLINKLNKSSTNAKTQIDYCFTNVNDLKSDYFESLTSFHKPIWIRKHQVLSKFHFDATEDIHTNILFDIDDAIIDDQSDVREVDEEFSFDHHETVDKNEQIDLDMSFQLEDLKVNDPSDMMEIDEQSFSEDYEIIDSNLQELIDRLSKGTAGYHLKYIGYKSDTNKLGFCVYYNGIHYDALLPYRNNPQQFVPYSDLINMSV
ncbi:unnamed protein product [Adineta steineri]|uniref:ATP-dependent DNA helicase n=1 Tax=Adineta steineri TaxID=433720 RepID=A0A819NWZ6_9BILA|nr:unnamed protein product [Adineta steineri]